MNRDLGATYTKQFGDYWVLWYAKSNSFSVVEPAFKILLDLYLYAVNSVTFKSKIADDNGLNNPDSILETLETYLKDCNQESTSPEKTLAYLDTTKRRILKQYTFQGKIISIYYDSEPVLKTVHPALAHLTSTSTDKVDTTFDIYIHSGQLFLFKDAQLLTSVPKKDYHFIQGKFIMHLLCTIHNKKEEDWIGTFHGSTLTDGHSSILFVGESGKGKSTLCALLAHKGFDLLADDVSPLLSETKSMYYNPLAISIKEGAFKVLEPIVDDFDNLPTVNFNKAKGPIKYLPCRRPKKDHYPCKAIVLVNYKANSETRLEPASIKTVLETLIPDSWLSPNPIHAKQFLDWLETVAFYQLTYSDTDSVTLEISKLFKEQRHNL